LRIGRRHDIHVGGFKHKGSRPRPYDYETRGNFTTIIGGHSIIYSTNPDADRAFLRDVLKFTNVDVGGGWLIFGLPPAELAVHPSDRNNVHEFYLMCDDVERFIAAMREHGIACDPVQDQGYGLVTKVTLPGGGKLGVYQPRHARPKTMSARKKSTGDRMRASKKRIKKAPKAKSRRR